MRRNGSIPESLPPNNNPPCHFSIVGFFQSSRLQAPPGTAMPRPLRRPTSPLPSPIPASHHSNFLDLTP
jgi:hypothetical protein